MQDASWPTEILGQARFDRYLRESDGVETRALSLYRHELDLAMHTFKLLALLEVALRNRICNLLEISEGPWDAALLRSLRGRTLAQLRKNQASVGASSSDSLMTAMNFGFWCALFEPALEPTLWNRHLSRIGKSTMPVSRREIARALDVAKKLRNRIAHHEPISKGGLQDQLASVWLVLAWLSDDLVAFAKTL